LVETPISEIKDEEENMGLEGVQWKAYGDLAIPNSFF
jgi:hypothetical protein